jgi:hypothetical protein
MLQVVRPPDDMSLESNGEIILKKKKPKNSEKTLSQYHFVHHKSQIN